MTEEIIIKISVKGKKNISELMNEAHNLLKDNLIGYYSIDSSLVKIVERESISY